MNNLIETELVCSSVKKKRMFICIFFKRCHTEMPWWKGNRQKTKHIVKVLLHQSQSAPEMRTGWGLYKSQWERRDWVEGAKIPFEEAGFRPLSQWLDLSPVDKSSVERLMVAGPEGDTASVAHLSAQWSDQSNHWLQQQGWVTTTTLQQICDVFLFVHSALNVTNAFT